MALKKKTWEMYPLSPLRKIKKKPQSKTCINKHKTDPIPEQTEEVELILSGFEETYLVEDIL